MSNPLTRTLTGVILLAVFGGWALLADPTAPEGVAWAAACALVAVGLVVGVVAGQVDPAYPGLFALAVAIGALVVTLPDSASLEPTAPPLGYLNANGAMLMCGAAGAVLAGSHRGGPWRTRAVLGAVGIGGMCLVGGMLTSALACLAIAGWGAVRGRGPGLGWLVVGAATTLLPPLLTLGWASQVLPRPGWVVDALSPERFALWRQAWLQLVDDPLTGVGPGRFSELAPTAAADPDLAWAHSTLLQTGAELGWVGIALLVAIWVWGLVALGRDGVLLGILMLTASVDYVLHFGAVLLLVSVVVGGALAVSGTGKPTLTPPSP